MGVASAIGTVARNPLLGGFVASSLFIHNNQPLLEPLRGRETWLTRQTSVTTIAHAHGTSLTDIAKRCKPLYTVNHCCSCQHFVKQATHKQGRVPGFKYSSGNTAIVIICMYMYMYRVSFRITAKAGKRNNCRIKGGDETVLSLTKCLLTWGVWGNAPQEIF